MKQKEPSKNSTLHDNKHEENAKSKPEENSFILATNSRGEEIYNDGDGDSYPISKYLNPEYNKNSLDLTQFYHPPDLKNEGYLPLEDFVKVPSTMIAAS